MCGIFGYLGSKKAVPLVLEGLIHLEYRGYDSAGIAAIEPQKLLVKKTIGRVSELASSLKNEGISASLAIGHTRWATHGVPTEINAHPHIDTLNSCAVVHNGIVENFKELRALLEDEGIRFSSETDSEVIAQLFSWHYQSSKDLLRSFSWTLSQLQGSIACVIIHKEYPDVMLCASQESPLILGLGEDEETFVASDSRAFCKYAKRVQSLASGELAVIQKRAPIEFYNFELKKITKEFRQIAYSEDTTDKCGYSYYMLKEIYEQPDVLEHLIDKYLEPQGGLKNNFLSELPIEDFDLISIVACGSSYHAGYLAKYIIEATTTLPVHIEVASEFRYRHPYIGGKTLAILISQSGETADTLAAFKELRLRNVAATLGICNVPESTLAMGVDYCLFLEAGVEIGVASTKAFTSQLLLLMFVGLKLATFKGKLSSQDLHSYIQGLKKLPSLCRQLLTNDLLFSWAQAYHKEDKFLFLGRRFMYPIVMEAALKLKEIAYVEANAYPAGEMKHGPIALIFQKSPVIVFCGDSVVYEKMIGNIMEVKARRAHVIAIASENHQDIAAVSDKQLYVPESHNLVAPVLYAIVGQVMAYAMALDRGNEIDYPRNLAKSVTVE
ncbi:glutamine--fructose-6-phosphate transaminase (isomerizing) [Chlamydia pecorum]|uniref:Glutamine--fructose-6-phosphate aminotransferase [isomerizing] n=1 Tax=Chlamydia pecorum (strain ATCC VR-628 / DSM 29919 / E58) TaxID=331635 RepID=A0AA34WHN9_CHLPE|nr:glutamine--fructose-6-phosphate transaminase (isomerizing) [Chlamydia pecorum]AEB41097.1 glucosamine--fructose-6-phosphate aminotransferase, isomerizing [Chlamydia pecorum E58]UFP06690.1 glutamine--fructose-6-phosphate transaminase (isomerizing) [Chlamydia pecorum]UJT76482.1 glucosamine--fructose-6-phosphate aminotransferase, isomerizing [Chlamydia pecorum]